MEDSIIIKRSELKTHLQCLNSEEIIRLLNTAPPPFLNIKKEEGNDLIPFEKGKRSELSISEGIKDFESRKPPVHSGDLLIWKKDFPEIIIMLEIKNYSSNVPHDQYDKFIYDLELNKFTGGIFISNKPISNFSEPQVQSNKIILFSHDEKLIQLACDTLWIKLYESMRFGFLTSDLSEQCTSLSSGLETLVRVKTNVENMCKSVKKTSALIVRDIDKHIYDSREIVKQIMLNFKTIIRGGYVTAPVLLPELTCAEFKVPLEKFINSNEFLEGLDTKQIYTSSNKNIFEITYPNLLSTLHCEPRISTKKLKLILFKTKVEICFKPRIFDFKDVEFLNYSAGEVCFILTKKNIASSIYENILKFWQ